MQSISHKLHFHSRKTGFLFSGKCASGLWAHLFLKRNAFITVYYFSFVNFRFFLLQYEQLTAFVLPNFTEQEPVKGCSSRVS